MPVSWLNMAKPALAALSRNSSGDMRTTYCDGLRFASGNRQSSVMYWLLGNGIERPINHVEDDVAARYKLVVTCLQIFSRSARNRCS